VSPQYFASSLTRELDRTGTERIEPMNTDFIREILREDPRHPYDPRSICLPSTMVCFNVSAALSLRSALAENSKLTTQN
jgi:hypothetical protein